MLGQEVSLGKIIHGDKHATLNLRIAALAPELRQHVGEHRCTVVRCLVTKTRSHPALRRMRVSNSVPTEALENDDLSLLSGMTEKERKKLHGKGIFTVTQLSYTFCPRRRAKRLRDKPEKYQHSLRRWLFARRKFT